MFAKADNKTNTKTKVMFRVHFSHQVDYWVKIQLKNRQIIYTWGFLNWISKDDFLQYDVDARQKSDGAVMLKDNPSFHLFNQKHLDKSVKVLCLPGIMLEPVKLDPASFLCADPHWRWG